MFKIDALARALRLLVVLALWPTVAAAEEWSTADQAAMRATIESQMAAFRRDDGVAAFSYAAPAIRRKFQTPAMFMAGVRQSYAPVYRPREVEFRALAMIAGAPTQEVLVVGPDGVVYLAYYVMEQQVDGRWLIDACILRRLAETAA